jgi:hypothetical protein
MCLYPRCMTTRTPPHEHSGGPRMYMHVVLQNIVIERSLFDFGN